ncbi:hypothetical protein HOY80DRAFT_976006 [Tuber brumale]|nr:hypothetical protein HOY80DRAFT_976006 [Tuber brumale]
MSEENPDTKKRKSEWITSCSKTTIPEAEKRLQVGSTLPAIPVKKMLEGKNVLFGKEDISKTKEEVYKDLVGYLEIKGCPDGTVPDFNEANINDLILFTIYPVLRLFKYSTARNLRLCREKEIASVDPTTSGVGEFVVMDNISRREKKFVLIVEARKDSLGEGRKQFFLSMKDMRDNNGGGTVYGFITTGDSWRMVGYDGAFKITENMEILFDTVGEDKGRWMEDYSILVDCFNVALSDGGMKKQVGVV